MQRVRRPAIVLVLATVSSACFEPVPNCSDNASAADGCFKAADLFHYLTPQFGRGRGAGNATPGLGGVLRRGQYASVSASVRTGTGTDAPRMDASPPGLIITSSQYPTAREAATQSRVDASLALTPRFHGLVGFDLLFSATSAPGRNLPSITVERSPKFVPAVGIRMGMPQSEKGKRPGFGLSILTTTTQRYAFSVSTASGGMSISNMEVLTTAVQISGGRQGERFGIAAGLGELTTTGDATVRAWSGSESSPNVGVRAVGSVSNAFVDGTVKLGRVTLVVGLARTGRISNIRDGFTTTNQYSPDGRAARTVMTIGARVGG